MNQNDASINGALLRLNRETRGWGQSDVATRACMSVKQVRQLEDGGLSAFYSEAVKVTAARKVGALLGMRPEEVFSLQPEPAPELPVSEASAESHLSSAGAASAVVVTPADDVIKPATTAPSVVTTASSVSEASSAKPEPAPELAASQEAGRSKLSLSWILALFAGAIVVAAWMRPDPQPQPTESVPPPPLQQLPAAETEPAASAASAAASSPVVTASMPLAVASVPVITASASRGAASMPAVPNSALGPATSTPASASKPN